MLGDTNLLLGNIFTNKINDFTKVERDMQHVLEQFVSTNENVVTSAFIFTFSFCFLEILILLSRHNPSEQTRRSGSTSIDQNTVGPRYSPSWFSWF
jgi:hypothetical protein